LSLAMPVIELLTIRYRHCFPISSIGIVNFEVCRYRIGNRHRQFTKLSISFVLRGLIHARNA
jgi:hypothetical protein